ncbi:hypothetical protein QYF36_005892 [Acer negundo]|nr:hypothetical protein QYF36_005892 [Acer negundo]
MQPPARSAINDHHLPPPLLHSATANHLQAFFSTSSSWRRHQNRTAAGTGLVTGTRMLLQAVLFRFTLPQEPELEPNHGYKSAIVEAIEPAVVALVVIATPIIVAAPDLGHLSASPNLALKPPI